MSEGARARDLGIVIGTLSSGPADAITDVTGVRVGHTTLIEGRSVRTGVTVVLPHDGNPGRDPVFAGSHRLNGNGEMTGLEWVRESGLLSSPIALTNTFSVGVVRDELVATGLTSGLPVVAETFDGGLNDIYGMHVRPEHLRAALEVARGTNDGAEVDEGSVGGGTGMICHDFKGGIGTASRVVPADAGGYTVGVLVQANHGRRERLRVNGVPVGERVTGAEVPPPVEQDWPVGGRARSDRRTEGPGSIIILVATNAPLLPGQCDRLAQRAGFGVARTGGVGEHSSGDLILAFSTANRSLQVGESGPEGNHEIPIRMLSDAYITPLFDAVIDATEEAIVNALLAARTMGGHSGTAYALDGDTLLGAMNA
ncbi:MAG: P1 family peptidase [Actinomycetota bacterium]|nr:P1 family peptidase [Actinomycetota bacterium]